MNPADAPAADRKLYYELTWLRHTTEGIGEVYIGDQNQFYFAKLESCIDGAQGPGLNVWTHQDPILVAPETLSCWWPRAGAHNLPTGALYITRKAIRAMHKSAKPEVHYSIKWGEPCTQYVMMWALAQDFPRISAEEAFYCLQNNEITSVALNRDIILQQGLYNKIHVLFRGTYVGDYHHGEFIPSFEGAPISKRILYKLLNQERT